MHPARRKCQKIVQGGSTQRHSTPNNEEFASAPQSVSDVLQNYYDSDHHFGSKRSKIDQACDQIYMSHGVPSLQKVQKTIIFEVEIISEAKLQCFNINLSGRELCLCI